MASLCSRLAAARRCGGLVVPRRGLQNVLSSRLPNLELAEFVAASTRLCRPDSVHVCNGSESENATLLALMQEQGVLRPLKKYHNCWLARTDPRDVARVESRTVLVTASEQDAVPQTSTGVPSQLGRWMSESDFEKAFQDRFPGCMEGRTMYVIPFSMGPLRSPLARFGVQLTDSPYVVASMRTMTRMGTAVLDALADKPFVKCLHSVGQPLPLTEPLVNGWACDPERTLIAHLPARREIVSFGSGYGGNSLLGKKCFALRIASRIARDEGWLAEHMLIVGVTNPVGRKKYMAAAFPSACGKTNLAMMTPSLPGWKIECVGDDIAWMKFDDEGRLRAINPEAGFFGVAPGTSLKTNPNAMHTIHTNTLFTNVAERSDGGVYWEGIGEDVPPEVSITSWLNEPWSPGDKTPAAHPNSRFCVPASQCPSIDPQWESARGVPIDAIIFGGRRPHGVPLVYQSYDWQHGVFIGAGMRSESTAAAEHKGKQVMHDPFAMRPFFGYNFGNYLSHWLSMSRRTPAQLPKIFHVNWFRRDGQGNFLWPGFGENSRVLEWIFNRSDEVGDEEDGVVATPVGYVPLPDAINLSGLSVPPDMPELLSIPKDFWRQEVEDLGTYLTQQVNKDLPQEISRQLAALRGRIEQI